MKVEGGCYCGAVRYSTEGEPMMMAQCYCRECQHYTGGAPNLFVAMPEQGFAYVKGEPKSYTRPDLERAVTRQFCAECGAQLATRAPGFPAVIVKVGGLDDPSVFSPKIAMFTCDAQPFHDIPDGVAAFARLPG